MAAWAKHIFRISAVLLVTGGLLNLHPQTADPFAELPKEQAQRLTARLNAFVSAHKQKNFDYLGDQYLMASKKRYDKSEFVDKKLYSRFNRFTPKSVQEMGNGFWMILGCGSFSNGGKMEVSVEAYFEKQDWFFSEIWSVSPCIDCRPRSCRHK